MMYYDKYKVYTPSFYSPPVLLPDDDWGDWKRRKRSARTKRSAETDIEDLRTCDHAKITKDKQVRSIKAVNGMGEISRLNTCLIWHSVFFFILDEL